jgi:UDP-N-acetylglucosamine--N-acetylmuramyl-(pentapeptide) pyrophosphoryl-undecaprenol N-acetylglucosamine transferase
VEKKRYLIMAGGTGGHVFPALAIAEAIQQHGDEVYWLGTKQGLEAKLVPQADIPIQYISVNGLRGKRWLALALAPWRLLRALYQALRIMRSLQPNAVIGMGGFASGPGGIAAWVLRKPLLIHEQNSVAGLTNRILAKLAKKTLQAFPQAFAAKAQAMTVGNPVREALTRLPAPSQRQWLQDDTLHILVLGGSQGAVAINTLLPQALSLLPAKMRYAVKHQAGAYGYQQCQQDYAKLSQVEVVPFIEDMAQAYAWADIVVCRAGALTVAELTTVGLPSILIPFPYAVDDHQTRNAQYLVEAGAAVLQTQAQLEAAQLAQLLLEFSQDRQRLESMANAAYALRKANVAETIRQQLEGV